LLAGPAAATIGERLILDGCEVSGGGNDIHSVQSHYDAKRDQIVVTLRLCSAARPRATCRVHVDHAAPFVGKAGTPATCATTADSVVARTPGGHRGVGTSRILGNLVRFVVPLTKLNVGKPKDAALIPFWATSRLGGTVDRAPNRETGDGCVHPQATTETLLVQTRVAITGLAFVSSYSLSGAIGFTDADGIFAWLSNGASSPASSIRSSGRSRPRTAPPSSRA
jgi:hypothetical protein